MAGCFSKRILDITEIHTKDFANPWNFSSLFLKDSSIWIKWLQDHCLLVDSVTCGKCGLECKMGVRSKKKDGYAWRCPNRAHEFSIRRNSFFERAQFPIPDVMEFVISFAEKQSLYRASVGAGMHYGTSAVYWANFIRDCCKGKLKIIWETPEVTKFGFLV